MATVNSAIPPFLAITSRPALANILSTLGEREQQRRALAEQGRMRAAMERSTEGSGIGRNAPAPPSEGEEEESNDWFAVAAGTTRENMSKNRYGDIIAYDRTRCLPPLRTTAAGNEPSYVNASLVQEPQLGLPIEQLKRRWWVAAQAPIPSTVHDFLSLLLTPPSSLAYQTLSTVSPTTSPSLPLINLIVQLTPLVEGRREKCHPYFPPEVGQKWDVPSASKELGQGVWVRLEKQEEKEGARTSELTVGQEGETQGKKVVHVEYLGWRDHGVPDSPTHLVRFIKRIHSLKASLAPTPSATSSSTPSPDPPILLHCSAGVGRTGTLLAISSLLPFLSLLRSSPFAQRSWPIPPTLPSHPLGAYPATTMLAGGVPDYVGLTIDGLRDQRTTMAQTQEQVLFIYQALIAAWETGLV
ncbi:hypothetical protein JCM11251_004547 [Rhodosporidiobolus azoricus]